MFLERRVSEGSGQRPGLDAGLLVTQEVARSRGMASILLVQCCPRGVSNL